MRELDVFRKVMTREARRAAGRHPLFPTVSQAQTSLGGLEDSFLALPEDIEGLQEVQDPVTGAFWFMVDFSPVDGADPVA